MSEDAREKADRWNEKHPIGTRVRYWPGIREGEGRSGRTSSRADVLGSPVFGTPVVWIAGRAGCIALSHVEPASLLTNPAKNAADRREDAMPDTDLAHLDDSPEARRLRWVLAQDAADRREDARYLRELLRAFLSRIAVDLDLGAWESPTAAEQTQAAEEMAELCARAWAAIGSGAPARLDAASRAVERAKSTLPAGFSRAELESAQAELGSARQALDPVLLSEMTEALRRATAADVVVLGEPCGRFAPIGPTMFSERTDAVFEAAGIDVTRHRAKCATCGLTAEQHGRPAAQLDGQDPPPPGTDV